MVVFVQMEMQFKFRYSSSQKKSATCTVLWNQPISRSLNILKKNKYTILRKHIEILFHQTFGKARIESEVEILQCCANQVLWSVQNIMIRQNLIFHQANTVVHIEIHFNAFPMGHGLYKVLHTSGFKNEEK